MANAEPYVERVFHGATTGATDFVLSVLSKAHPHYPSLADQFANKWVKPEPAGGVSVEKIFTVEVGKNSELHAVGCKNPDANSTIMNGFCRGNLVTDSSVVEFVRKRPQRVFYCCSIKGAVVSVEAGGGSPDSVPYS